MSKNKMSIVVSCSTAFHGKHHFIQEDLDEMLKINNNTKFKTISWDSDNLPKWLYVGIMFEHKEFEHNDAWIKSKVMKILENIQTGKIKNIQLRYNHRGEIFGIIDFSILTA